MGLENSKVLKEAIKEETLFSSEEVSEIYKRWKHAKINTLKIDEMFRTTKRLGIYDFLLNSAKLDLQLRDDEPLRKQGSIVIDMPNTLPQTITSGGEIWTWKYLGKAPSPLVAQAVSQYEEVLLKTLATQFDTNGDGEINFKEFVAGLSVIARGTRADKARLQFRSIDLNGDHVLSKEEVHVLLKNLLMGIHIGCVYGLKRELSKTVECWQIAKSEQFFDTVHTELAKFFLSDEVIEVCTNLMFKYIDTNADTVLSEEEFVGFYCDNDKISALKDDLIKSLTPNLAKTSKQITSQLLDDRSMKKEDMDNYMKNLTLSAILYRVLENI